MKILKALHDISSQANSSTDEKLQRLLQLGLDALEMDLGLVSEIVGDEYRVLAAVTPDNSIEKGACFSLGDTYCKDTLGAGAVVAYHNAAQEPGVSHPCYQNFSLKSYIGIPYFVNGVCHGTVNFSCPEARNREFSQDETDYIILLAEWVGSELSRKQQLDELLALQHEQQHQHMMHLQMSELARVGTWEANLSTGEVIFSDTLRAIYDMPDDFELNLAEVRKLVLHENDLTAFEGLFAGAMETGEAWSYEFETMSLTGRRFWVQTRCRKNEAYPDERRFYGASQDVTERVLAAKELENRRTVAEQALQSRSLFLANMSHEIRTPINGVVGMLDTLRRTGLDDKQAEYCQLAKHSADSLLQIINDVLDFSKIDAGELELESVPLSLSKLAEEQYRVFCMPAQKKYLKLTVETSATDGLQFMGDPTRIRQVFTNLISNAIKFSDRGEVNISTSAIKQSDTHYLVQVVVKDSGVGIAPEHQAVIFSPFRQGDSETTRKFGGTGLGLSIVSQIAEHMNGGIRVNSKPGEGSTFIVALSLPVAADNAQVQPDGEDVSTEKPADLSNKRVLVVEDNEINQLVVCEQLKEFGIEAEIASHGADAVERVVRSLSANTQYDLILMDCHMPVMDGYEAASRIRQLGPAAQLIPIVALTANVLVGEREKCLMAGMNDYLSKPVETKQFNRCIHRYLLA